VNDHAAHDWMIGVQRVAGSTEIRVLSAIGLQNVIAKVVDAAKAECRPVYIVFRRVIEDHIENYFDSGAMQSLDHIAEFIHRALRGLQ
jgi:hypothetical protein